MSIELKERVFCARGVLMNLRAEFVEMPDALYQAERSHSWETIQELRQRQSDLPELIRAAYAEALRAELEVKQSQLKELQVSLVNATALNQSTVLPMGTEEVRRTYRRMRSDLEQTQDGCNILQNRLNDSSLQLYMAFCHL